MNCFSFKMFFIYRMLITLAETHVDLHSDLITISLFAPIYFPIIARFSNQKLPPNLKGQKSHIERVSSPRIKKSDHQGARNNSTSPGRKISWWASGLVTEIAKITSDQWKASERPTEKYPALPASTFSCPITTRRSNRLANNTTCVFERSNSPVFPYIRLSIVFHF